VVTDTIPHDATAELVELLLNKALAPRLGRVTVDVLGGGAASGVCGGSGALARVRFRARPTTSGEGGGGPARVAVSSTYEVIAVVSSTLPAGSGNAVLAVRSGGTASTVLATVSSVTATREAIECSGRGTCDHLTGQCTCFGDYGSSDGRGAGARLSDCGAATATIAACPSYKPSWSTAAAVCSGAGTCLGAPSYKCNCNAGYSGYACEKMSCPAANAWVDVARCVSSPFGREEETGRRTDSVRRGAACRSRLSPLRLSPPPLTSRSSPHPPTHSASASHRTGAECSNAGRCDTGTGACACASTLYTGTACQHISCPGRGADECGGVGKCTSMKALGLERRHKGERRPVNYTAPWEAKKIRTCVCKQATQGADAQRHAPENPSSTYVDVTYRGPWAFAATDFIGYKCTEIGCPLGDDPYTYGVTEVQIVFCDAGSG